MKPVVLASIAAATMDAKRVSRFVPTAAIRFMEVELAKHGKNVVVGEESV